MVWQSFNVEGVFSEEGNLTDVLREDNYKNLISSANTLQEAINYIKKLYGTTEGIFAALANARILIVESY